MDHQCRWHRFKEGQPLIGDSVGIPVATTRPTLSLFVGVLATACQSERSPDKRPAIAQTQSTAVVAESAQYVPDEQTAIRIAESVLIQRYGRDQIESEKPLTATLRDTVWTVTGTLPA